MKTSNLISTKYLTTLMSSNQTRNSLLIRMITMSIVKKRLKDVNEKPIGVANENPLLESIMYEVEYLD